MRPTRIAAAAAGLILAWVGLALTWERWSGLVDDGVTHGFGLADARPYLVALAVTTPLALVFAIKRRFGGALFVAAIALVALAARAALALHADSSTFVDVGTGPGLWLSVTGAVPLAVAAAPPGRRAAAVAIVPAVAAIAWPHADPRPADGRMAEVGDTFTPSLALDGDTLLTTPSTGGTVAAWSRDGRRRRAADINGGHFGYDSISAIALQGRDLYVSLAGGRGLERITPDGERRLLAMRPKHEWEDVPLGDPQIVPGLRPVDLAAAPDGSVYVLSRNQVYSWDGRRLEPAVGTGARGFAGDGGPAREAQLDTPQDIAVDRAGRLYIADTGNGRIRRVERDGTIHTVLGADAAPGCVTRGGDEPLTLDPHRCHGVETLAVDSRGSVFLATRGVARILALTPAGRLGVVAGTGPMGQDAGDGRAVSARFGVVLDLIVGPHDDLYVAEFAPAGRVRRIAAPAAHLDARPAAGEPPPSAVCRAIAAWGDASMRLMVTDERDPEALRRAVADAETATGRLDPAAPDSIAEETASLRADVRALRKALEAVQYDGKAVREANALDDLPYAEHVSALGDRCGFAGRMLAIEPHTLLRFCVAYLRDSDRARELPDDDPREARLRLRSTALLPPRFAPHDLDQDALPVFARLADDVCSLPPRWATGDE